MGMKTVVYFAQTWQEKKICYSRVGAILESVSSVMELLKYCHFNIDRKNRFSPIVYEVDIRVIDIKRITKISNF